MRAVEPIESGVATSPRRLPDRLRAGPGLRPRCDRGDLSRRRLSDAPDAWLRGHLPTHRPFAAAVRADGSALVVVEGADHMIPGRHPVLANLLIRDFIRSLAKETVQ